MGQAIGLAVWRVFPSLTFFEISAKYLLYTLSLFLFRNYFSQLVQEGWENVCKWFLWLTLWSHSVPRPLKVQWENSKMCDHYLSKQREIMQKKMHVIYSKVHCAEKEINGRKEERHREALHLSLSFQICGRVLSMFSGFTGSLKNEYQFARSTAGSADGGFAIVFNILGQKQPEKGVAIFQRTLRPWALCRSLLSSPCMLAAAAIS